MVKVIGSNLRKSLVETLTQERWRFGWRHGSAEPNDTIGLEQDGPRMPKAGILDRIRRGCAGLALIAGIFLVMFSISLVSSGATMFAVIIFVLGASLIRFSFQVWNSVNSRIEEMRREHKNFERVVRSPRSDWQTFAVGRKSKKMRDNWQSVVLTTPPNRVDVFGGTAIGWDSLLATLGSSLLIHDWRSRQSLFGQGGAFGS